MQNKKKVIAVVLGIACAIIASYVSALSRPTTVGANNPSKFIHVGNVAQTKIGQMNVLSLMVGDYGNSMSNNVLVIDNLGGMAVGKRTTTSGIALDVVGTTGIAGSIKSSAFAFTGTGKRPVCADASGTLFLCNYLEYKVSDSQSAGSISSRYGSFVVPDGVTSLTVEMYGGGGAGYGSANNVTGSDDGESSFFNGGSSISLIANGGTGSNSLSVPGTGGTATTTGVTSLITKNGPNGDAMTSSYGVVPSVYGNTRNCNGTTYYAMKGGTGDIGGNGGSLSANTIANGGIGGVGGPLSGTTSNNSAWSFIDSTACNFIDYYSDQLIGNGKYERPGSNGADGILGGGGGGFGGRGGASGFFSTQSCPINSSDDDGCTGGAGAAGGGSGSYIKSTFSVSPGQTFYIKIGRGGIPLEKTCTSSGSGGINCDKIRLQSDGGGAVSGKGGDGYIKITY